MCYGSGYSAEVYWVGKCEKLDTKNSDFLLRAAANLWFHFGSVFGRFTPRERAPGARWIGGWVNVGNRTNVVLHLFFLSSSPCVSKLYIFYKTFFFWKLEWSFRYSVSHILHTTWDNSTDVSYVKSHLHINDALHVVSSCCCLLLYVNPVNCYSFVKRIVYCCRMNTKLKPFLYFPQAALWRVSTETHANMLRLDKSLHFSGFASWHRQNSTLSIWIRCFVQLRGRVRDDDDDLCW
jgi:hypothetical protein